MTVPVCVVWAFATAGGADDELLQQMPQAVMGALPSLVTVPPPVAASFLMSSISEVVITVGGAASEGKVEKITLLPYEVSKQLVA